LASHSTLKAIDAFANDQLDTGPEDMTTSTATALDELFSESAAAIVRRRLAAFDQLADGADKPVVLYGAGGLGRIILKGLRNLGRPPVAFADKRMAGSSAPIDSVPVFSPAEAAERFGSEAVFVVSIWNAQTDHQYTVTRKELRRLGARHVAPALALFWKYPETFLPYYCLDVPELVLAAKDDIRRLAKELADDVSRDVLVRQLRWRIEMDFEALPFPVRGPAYFQPDLLPPRQDELFVDCGAYDGDSLRMFRSRMEGNAARTIAIEPDPASYARLEAYANALPADVRERVRMLNVAVGRIREKLRFDSSGLASAHASDTGTIEVDCLPLDEILEGETPTLIKMDLEGAELDALFGGDASIRLAGPSMAVCVYHRPDHLWAIPLLLRRMLPNHTLHLRPHGYEGWDLVCYAVAPGRS
jgi:FkbM family methyltransferase